MKISKTTLFLGIAVLILNPACSQSDSASLVLTNGKIATVDADFSIHEAVAVTGNRIMQVGRDRDIRKYIGPETEVIDLKGRLALPGLIDAHGHLSSLADEITFLNISSCTSYQQIIDKVAERAASSPPGEWITGGRWDHNDWEEKVFPVHESLSRISSANPVYLRRVDGNSAFVNQRALEIAGITRETPDPFGGVIVRGASGEPTGILINRAMNLVLKHIPSESAEQHRENFLKAVDNCLSAGLTGVHEAGVDPGEIGLYKELIDQNRLGLRIYAMLGAQEESPMEGDLVDFFKRNRIEEYGGHFLSVRSIKLFFDGALGSRGAAFYAPYTDDPENSGLLRITPEYITRVAKAALEADMGVNTHCIGIRGNRLCLDAYAAALRKFPSCDHRFRIEHAQFVRPEDIAIFSEFGIIPSMQPTHCTSDMPFVEDRVGPKRAGGGYVWRSFLDAGHIIPCGSDFPVESNNPLWGIYAAVTRQDHNGLPESGWHPEQRMTIREAVRGYTSWAAYAAFQEDILGSIETGKLADFTILDTDILEAEPAAILSARPDFTIVDGKIRFRRN